MPLLVLFLIFGYPDLPMKKYLIAVRKIVARAFRQYQKDGPIQLAGTTAFFTIFAIAPIFVIITSLLGIILGEDEIARRILDEIQSLIGQDGAEFVATLIEDYGGTERNITGTIIGLAVLLVTSTTFFTILQNSINYIWRIRAKPKSNLLKALKDRLLSFGLILSIGFILLVLLIVDAALSFFGEFLTNYMEEFAVLLVRILNIIVSFGVLVLIFALIYRYLPDARIKWNITWVGAIITAALFVAGRYVIGLALGMADIGVMYGAAGSVVIFLLWVFYSSIILFLGAEITRQYAIYFGYSIEPKKYAVRIEISEKSDSE
jgi:membrane protein